MMTVTDSLRWQNILQQVRGQMEDEWKLEKHLMTINVVDLQYRQVITTELI